MGHFIFRPNFRRWLINFWDKFVNYCVSKRTKWIKLSRIYKHLELANRALYWSWRNYHKLQWRERLCICLRTDIQTSKSINLWLSCHKTTEQLLLKVYRSLIIAYRLYRDARSGFSSKPISSVMLILTEVITGLQSVKQKENWFNRCSMLALGGLCKTLQPLYGVLHTSMF